MARLYSNRFGQICVCILLAFAPINTWAQILLSNAATYTENFDGMGSTTTLPANWRMAASTLAPTWSAAAGTVTQQASSGSPTTGGTYNWGNSVSERAVGAMTSGNFDSPNNLLAFFQNTSNSGIITELRISYNAERYRINTAAASIQFFYSLNGSTWISVSAGDIASTAFATGTSAYTFTTPLEVSRTFSISSLNLAQGQSFYLRWNINTTGANSQGIGIDNVNITPTFIFQSTNIPSNPGVNWVGANQGYSVPLNCNEGSPFVMNYRRVATTATSISDGRGQWATTLSAQASGGDVALQNMTGGNGNGFLFISGGSCGSTGNYANKWVFSGVGSAALNGINNTNHFTSGGNDMGLNMSTAGFYTFVLRDAGYTNSNFYVGFTENTPITISHNPASQVILNGNYSISVQTSLSATPSAGERVFLRFKVNNNDFGTATTSIVEGTVSGTTATFTIPTQSTGTTVNYYLFTSTLTLATLNGLSESDRSLAVLRINDNNNTNFSYTIPSPQTYTWNGGATGSWMVATNWSPNGVPSNTDAIIFNNAAAVTVTDVPTVNLRSISMSGAGSLTWQASSAAILTVGLSGANNPVLAVPAGKQFTLAGTNAINIGINSGFTALINGRVTFTQAAHRLTAQSVNGISFENGSLFEAQTGFTGNPFGATGTNGSVVFRNGATYEHRSGANPFGGVSITTFESQSFYRYLVPSFDNPSLSGRTYGNFEFGVARTAENTGTNGFIINNLIISVSGVTWNILTSGSASINGNISVADGSTLNYSPAAPATLNLTTNPQTINTNGTGIFSIGTNGTVIVRSGADVQLLGETVISGAGSFVVESGATLGIGSANGITATASAGNVQTANRTFNTGANYRYQGNTNQFTGNGLPLTVNTLLISNTGPAGSNTVTLTNTNTTTTRLDLNNGLLAAGTSQNLNIANGGRINGNGGGQPANATAGTVTFLGGSLTSQTNGFQAGQPILYAVIQQGGVDYNGNPNTNSATILNSLRMDAGSFVTDAPFYANGSSLIYNSGGVFGRNAEWGASANQGYPHHVVVQGNTILDLNTNTIAPPELGVAGDLIIGNATGRGEVYLNNNMNKPLLIRGNLIIGNNGVTAANNSRLQLSNVAGGDLILHGNFERHSNGFFDDIGRATFLRGNTNSSINTPGVTPGAVANNATQFFTLLFIEKASTTNTITLNCPVAVSNTLHLTSGQIASSINNLLILPAGATYTGGNNDNSYVTGPMRKIGNTAFRFPVGKAQLIGPVAQGTPTVGGFRPIDMSAPGNINDAYTAEFFVANANLLGPIAAPAAPTVVRVSSCEYWSLDRFAGSSNTALNVSIRWEARSKCNVGNYVTNPATIVVASSTGTPLLPGSGPWNNYGGAAVGTNAAGTVTWSNFNIFNTGRTPFALASINQNDNPLPFRFTSFSATGRSKQAQLDWSVNINAHIVTYTVERSSDGRNFGPVYSVNSTLEAGVATYRHFDLSAPDGWNYYRLRAIDYQGETHFSAIQKVWLGSGSTFQMSPNPTRNTLNITLSATNNWQQVQITNAVGQVLLQQPALQGTRSIDLSKLPAGLYYLRLLGTGGTEVHSFIKE